MKSGLYVIKEPLRRQANARKGGKALYGASVGILMLDAQFPAL